VPYPEASGVRRQAEPGFARREPPPARARSVEDDQLTEAFAGA
jgi:hypothetical protein